jgi:uncharacterized protein
MDFSIFLANLTNPTLLFFGLGVLAARLKSDLELPAPTVKFLSLYLLFSIGFKGGHELRMSPFSTEVLITMLAGVLVSVIIPLYAFFVLKGRFGATNAGAVAAAYGSVSAVTFVSAAAFLESQAITYSGHMVAVMALMEAPAIIVGVTLIKLFEVDTSRIPVSVSSENKHEHHSGEPHSADQGLLAVIRHSFTNGSVLMVVGSLVIGLISDAKQAEGIKPFTTDIFKGFLALFLLEMGMVTAKRIGSLKKLTRNSLSFAVLFAAFAPLVHGIIAALASRYFISEPGDRLLFAVLAASASYIAVPAAMKMAAPKADPGLFLPMALAITFPVNLTLGIPLYRALSAGH